MPPERAVERALKFPRKALQAHLSLLSITEEAHLRDI